MNTTRTYDARVDSRNRITIRGNTHQNYRVYEMPDGRIMLEPLVLTPARVPTAARALSPEQLESEIMKGFEGSGENRPYEEVFDEILDEIQ